MEFRSPASELFCLWWCKKENNPSKIYNEFSYVCRSLEKNEKYLTPEKNSAKIIKINTP